MNKTYQKWKRGQNNDENSFIPCIIQSNNNEEGRNNQEENEVQAGRKLMNEEIASNKPKSPSENLSNVKAKWNMV